VRSINDMQSVSSACVRTRQSRTWRGSGEGSGEGGEVGRLTKTVLEAALKAQINEHQGYDGMTGTTQPASTGLTPVSG